MLKRYLSPRALTTWAACLLIAGLTLAACGGAAESVSEGGTADETETGAQTTAAETATESEATEEVAAVDAEEAQQGDLPAAPSQASCQSIDIPDDPLTPVASDDDWSKGLATASVTVIEYGDFQ